MGFAASGSAPAPDSHVGVWHVTAEAEPAEDGLACWHVRFRVEATLDVQSDSRSVSFYTDPQMVLAALQVWLGHVASRH